jgi:DNA polymerase-3 subunit beta
MAMQFSVDRSSLLKALSHVQSVVEKRTTIPILANVLLVTENNQVSLAATDMDMEMVDVIPASVGETGSTTVPVHTLYDIVRKLSDDATLHIQVNEAGTSMTINAGRSNFKLGCLPRDDFPEMNTHKAAHSFVLPASQLRTMIDRTRFAMSNEETRYYLNGIYVHTTTSDGESVLRAVATDGHRLARYQVALPNGADNMPGIIIPKKTVQELRRLLDEAGEDIRVELSDKMVRFAFDHVIFTSKVIDGTYPDYERVIPQGLDKNVIINTKSFTKAVDRVATLAAEKTRAVKLTIKDKTLTLSASNSESGSATEECEITYDGREDVDIGFNARYLLDVTQIIDSEARLALTDSASPAIIQDNNDPAGLFVLMPMRV